MDYNFVSGKIRTLCRNPATPVHFGFVSPITSVCLAASKVADTIDVSKIMFSSAATGYAEINGLRYHLGISGNCPPQGANTGKAYCRVAKLQNPAEVEACNANIGTLLTEQLGNCPNAHLVAATCGVVGELHDNVACHAYGCGFSAAQVYKSTRKVIQIAIADCGFGLGGSVRRAGIKLSDAESIEWCLKRGNSTAKTPTTDPTDFGPQFIPEDCLNSPYPEGIPTTSRGSHHMGEGLYRLTELVRVTGGSTCVWSGDGMILCEQESRITPMNNVYWKGTAIEIEIPVEAFEECPAATDSHKYDELARRLNL